jgi:hypothetical protein
MPYYWTTQPNAQIQIMQLKPHESLPARGMAAFVLVTFTLILIPAFELLDSLLDPSHQTQGQRTNTKLRDPQGYGTGGRNRRISKRGRTDRTLQRSYSRTKKGGLNAHLVHFAK